MAASTVRSLVGVYDADGTVLGEIAYWIGARLGRSHCSLCEVTHGLFTERPDWREWRASLGVPFELFHRDDVPEEIAAAIDQLPAVVARTSTGSVLVLGHDALERCGGDLARFVTELGSGLGAAGLELPPR